MKTRSLLPSERPNLVAVRAAAESPAHSLHHMCDEAVGDAWTGLLREVEGVLQLLDSSYTSATCPPLLLQLLFKADQVERTLQSKWVKFKAVQ